MNTDNTTESLVDSEFDLTTDGADEEIIERPWLRPGKWYVVHSQSGYLVTSSCAASSTTSHGFVFVKPQVSPASSGKTSVVSAQHHCRRKKFSTSLHQKKKAKCSPSAKHQRWSTTLAKQCA